MDLKLGDEGKRIFEKAYEKAREKNQGLTTLHLLLVFCEEPGLASKILADHGVKADWVRSGLRSGQYEPVDIFHRLNEETLNLAVTVRPTETRDSKYPHITDLHILAGLLLLKNSYAYRLLSIDDHNPDKICTMVMGCLAGTGRRPASLSAPSSPRASFTPEAYRRSAAGPASPAARPEKEKPQRPAQGQVRSLPSQMKLPLHTLQEHINRYGEAKRSGGRLPAPPPPPGSGVAARDRDRAPFPPSWIIDEKQFPVLTKICVNLNLRAWNNEFDCFLGRRREMESVMDVLGRRKGNNPILVGEPGVGKTAIVEGLAQKIIHGEVDGCFRGRIILGVVPSSFFGGTSLRGSLSERFAALRKEADRLRGRLVFFFDDASELLKSIESGGEGILHEIKEALSQGALPSIFTATPSAWKKIVDIDGGFSHCLTPIYTEEVSQEEAAAILKEHSSLYAAYHGVLIDQDSCAAAAALSTRYIAGRKNPEKSLMVLDLAAARASREAEKKETPRSIAGVVASLTDIPIERLAETDGVKLLHFEQELHGFIVGHDEAVARIAAAIRRNAAGFRGHRPIGSFLCLGPTGVGKTEMAKAMARVLFGRETALVRFDMSEFSEPHSVSRLIGAPPGYIGFEKGGELTDAMAEHSYRLVLMDEFEKAHAAVHRLLLQILEEGRLTDAHGRTVNFSNAILMLTSNVGSDIRAHGQAGFAVKEDGDRGQFSAKMRQRAVETFSPELMNRLDETIVFAPLTEEQVREIARRLLGRSAEAIHENRGIRVTWSDEVVGHLIEAGGFDPGLGARPMRRTIQATVEALVADAVISGKAREGASIHVSVKGPGKLACRIRNRSEKAPPPAPDKAEWRARGGQVDQAVGFK